LNTFGPPHLDHADLVLPSTRPPLGIGDAKVHARQGEAHGARDALAVVGVRGVHVGLGHAVALEDGVARSGLPLPVRVGEQRREPDTNRRIAAQASREARMLDRRRRRSARPSGGGRRLARDTVGSNGAGKSIDAPASTTLVATKSPWVWKIGSAWISTSSP
jgi:hypothetical protein